jgi:hypothetical protein
VATKLKSLMTPPAPRVAPADLTRRRRAASAERASGQADHVAAARGFGLPEIVRAEAASRIGASTAAA